MLAVADGLVRAVIALSDSIDMHFLYDPVRRLFVIGHNVSAGRRDNAYYDLLASEARLGSYTAIAAGQVPLEHWFSMSRPYNAVRGQRVLLSWTGTMFEYLMPLLLQRRYPNSLIDKAVVDAAEVQIDYGRRRGVPWGVSESAYGDLDLDKNYQYKAFGVPELGLKRDLEQEVVVAPYATLLALSITPRRAVRNLRRLADLGLLNDFGFFEAMDFSRRPRRRDERGVIVRAYMAHHEGMGLLALANLLHGNRFPRRFHADPRVRAVEPLLHERVPTLPPLHHISTREGVPPVESVAEVAPSVSRFDTPHTPVPKTQLLSNGRYGLMVTNAGGGYSQWGNIELTRWRSDRTLDAWGSFCYLYEADGDRLWSNTYHPVGGKVEGFAAHFALDRAVFRREDAGIHCETEMLVSPEDDVEIRRLTLVNRSLRTRTLDLTTYVELSLAPHNADRQHPAFNKLFIQTEAVPDHGALLAYRRPRGADESPVFVAHRLTPGDDEPLRFETDRRVFVGRGRTLRDAMGARQEPANTQGYVLDPILSLRRRLSLAPGQRRQVTLVLAAAESRDAVLALITKYSDPVTVERAMDVAWASAQLELRLLRIQPDDARRFQKLAANLLYPNDLLRPSADRVEERNRKGQSGLWPYGISGDLPIALVSVSEARDLAFVRQMLQAHSYLRAHGLTADLVILNEEAAGYEQPLRERLEGMIRLHSLYTGIDVPGGVFLRSSDQMPEEDRVLLLAAASVVMVAARGPLAQQLGVPAEPSSAPPAMAKKRSSRQPSAPLPFMNLPYFNSLGGFTGDGREYVIYLGPDTHTPAPWVNVIANPSFGTVVSETGAGFTWCGNSQRNRLTPWSNDPVLDTPGEAIYLRDEETGDVWTPTARPIRQASAYRARHGAGYSVFEHNSLGIEHELTVLVPTDVDGGEPIKLSRLRLQNDSPRPRRLSITYFVEWVLGEAREEAHMHVISSWDDDAQALLARNRFHPEYGGRVAFAALSHRPDSYTADRTSFLGRNRTRANPAAMEHERLSGRTGAGIDPCAALRVTVSLAPGEITHLDCLLGQVESVEQAHALVEKYREDLAFEAALDRTRAWWDETLGAIQVQTPEPSADFLVNRWLLYQTLSCRVWGRSAFYQSGGAYGFRDQLQDVMALLHVRPERAREQILLAAGRQFLEGDVQHWWHPPTGAGIRSRISDDMLWLPYVTAEYVRVTGDAEILHVIVPFLDGPTLTDDQHDLFLTPQPSLERASLFEHCARAVQRGVTAGPNGLPLIGTGDWNDGMDRVGTGGKGESVWLAWFVADVLEKMAELAETVGRAPTANEYRERRAALVRRIDDVSWDGAWYRRATFDDGTPLGSSLSPEAKIDVLPQAWAWLAGGGDPGHAAQALDSAWTHLVRPGEGLVLLFDPPFDKMEPTPGYIRGYPPGVRENGGQYTHGAMWLAMALARSGDGRRAVEILRMLDPVEHARDVEGVWRYGVEPYVVAADVYHAPGHVGQGGWSWYTGSAAWMYRAWVEEVLGLKVRGGTLRLDPVIPPEWPGFRLTYRHGEAVYEIQVENPAHISRGIAAVLLDGRPLDDKVIPLERELVKHRVVVRMGA
jgi:cyclic beta-1,2-glucan synthetase